MHGIIDNMIHVVFQHWLRVLVIAVAAWLLRNRYYNGLNKYPGPFMASLTDWWRFLDVWNRRPEKTHIRLHEKHGDVVRLGPNTLSFASPAATKAIYGLNKGYIKVSTRLRWKQKYCTSDIELIVRPQCRTVRFLRCTAISCEGTFPPESIQYCRQ